MTISVSQFFSSESSAQVVVNNMIEKLYQRPPNPRFLPHSNHRSERYLNTSRASADIAAIASTILQRQFDPFLNVRHAQFQATAKELFGHDPTLSKESAMRNFLFSRAITFGVASLGGCAFRASFASLVLAKVLPSESRLHVVSSPTKDQFVVQLFLEKHGWVIYDPLTNPDLFFPLQMYQKELLPTFADVPLQRAKFEMKITKELSEEFFRKSPEIQAKIQAKFLAALPRPEALLSEQNFRMCITDHGISLDAIAPKLNQALELLTTTNP